MSEEFRDRVVIVTGASGGIGSATVEVFIRAGARVGLFARSRQKLETLAAAYGSRALAVAGDVSDPADVERLFAGVESQMGACDVLVNCAGITAPERLVDTEPAAWDRVLAVNLRGAYLTTRRALPAMIARRSGAIVNVSSISGVIGPEKFPGYVSYCASKAALIAMTEALAVEVGSQGVRVNCVSPGSVDTKMWAAAGGGAPAAMTAHEVAESILFLASERSRPMNGQNLRLWSV